MQKSKLAATVLFFIIALIRPIRGLYFLVSADRKCFTIEQPRDTPIVFAYEILDAEHQIDFSSYYGALAKPELLRSKKTLKHAVGHEDLKTDNDGYYSICLQQANKEAFPTRVKLQITYGYDAEYYEKLVEEQKFDAINLEVHKLNDMMTLTLNEADYQKHKEVEYHSQTEQMETATLWWPVLQIGILVIAGILQVQNLKNFFKSIKLI